MRYEVQYKIEPCMPLNRRYGKSNLFPVLSIRFRKDGKLMWKKLEDVEIDHLTLKRFKTTYYSDFEMRTTVGMTLERRSDFERLSLFKEILEKEFDGSMDKFVTTIVKEKIVLDNAGAMEQQDAEAITMSLATGGWKKTSVEV